MTDLGTGIAALVGLLFVVLVLFGIFLLIRNFWLWYWGISAIQQVLRDQIAETRELRATVTVMLDGVHGLRGRQPVSTLDALVKNWRANGGTQIRAEYEQAF